MPLYTYTAIDKNGRNRNGEIQALDKAAVVALLEREHLTPLIVELKGGASKMTATLSFSFFQSISYVDKILLTKHLGAVVRAGLSMREALEILWEDAKKPLIKQILFDAKSNLERGQPLSMVFETYIKYFSVVFVGLVKAGEKSGTLENALENLGEQLIRDYDLIKKIRSAMIYPAILLLTSLGVVVLLLTFLLPRLVKVLSTTKIKLPLITRVLIYVSGVLSAKPLLTIFIFFAFLAGLIFAFRSPRVKAFLIIYLQKTPVLGEIIKKVAIARFARTFNNLLKSGLGALESLEITAHTVGNHTYQEGLLVIRDNIRKGMPLSDSFRAQEHLFPRLLISMIAVGERTGTLEKSLKTVSEFYDEEVDRALKNLVGMLEPILLVLMGVVVGGIALSVLLPIYQLVGSFR